MWTKWVMLLDSKIIHIATLVTQDRETTLIFLREIKVRIDKILHLDFSSNFHPKEEVQLGRSYDKVYPNI